MRKRTLATSVTIGAILAFGGAATPASAATGWSRCPERHFCAFTEPNGQGAIAIYQAGDPDLGDAYGPQGMNNNIESIWNRTGDIWGLYPNAYQAGGEGTAVGTGAQANFWAPNTTSCIVRH